MTANRLLLTILPAAIMIAALVLMSGFEHRLAALGTSAPTKLTLGRAGLALPYVGAAAIGVIALLVVNGSANIKTAGGSVLAGNAVTVVIAIMREIVRLAGIAGNVPAGQSVLAYYDPATMVGAAAAIFSGIFGLRVALKAMLRSRRPDRAALAANALSTARPTG